MTISQQDGPFEARITGTLMQVCRDRQALFTNRTDTQSGYVVRRDGLYAHDALTPLYQGGDAGQLLACITTLLEKRENRNRQGRLWTVTMAALGLVAVAAVSLVDLTAPASEAFSMASQFEKTLSLAPPAAPVLSVQPKVPEPTSAPAPALSDGWSLPLAARQGLPARLKKAAGRGMFTVSLSSRHARTLYVFADPLCANCQRMARHYAAVSARVNVVIFPVTIEGRAASLAALTPVMALPEAQRAAAWTSLFSADTGVGVPGSAPDTAVDATQAELARGAIGVNEVAFRAYRIPGTPWTVTDDGRYVPQAVLRDPDALDEFLNAETMHGQ